MRADKNPLLVICECAQIPRILKTCFDGALYQVQILKKYKNLNENIQLLANFKALEGGAIQHFMPLQIRQNTSFGDSHHWGIHPAQLSQSLWLSTSHHTKA